jgi:hypothetical protein
MELLSPHGNSPEVWPVLLLEVAGRLYFCSEVPEGMELQVCQQSNATSGTGDRACENAGQSQQHPISVGHLGPLQKMPGAALCRGHSEVLSMVAMEVAAHCHQGCV